MWFAPQRRAHSLQQMARASRIQGGSFFKLWLSHLHHAHSFIEFARFSRIPTINVRGMVFGKDSGFCGCSS
eukprot:3058279-Pyramimonas_sp.AAC.1